MATFSTTNNGAAALYQDQTFIPSQVVPDALIHTITTNAGDIEGDRPVINVPYVDDRGTVTFVPEGAEIPVGDVTLNQVSIHARKLARLQSVSREADRSTDAARLLALGLSHALTVAADGALFNSTETNLPGILTVEGINNGGTLGDGNLDSISNGLTQIESAGGTPSHIVCDPQTWGKLRLLKTGTGSAQPLLGAPAEQATKQLFGVPVVVTANIATGNILMLDKTSILSAQGPVMLDKSDQAAYTSDSIIYRIMWRMGWKVVRPDRVTLIKDTVAAG